jgi:putative lipoprotein
MRALLLAALLLAAAGAAAAAESRGEIRGTATYRERMALPEGARLEVDLLDVSKADAAAARVTGATYAIRHDVPIGFLLPYDPAAIDPAHRYALTARIFAGDALLFRSEGTTPVLTQGAGARVDMLLHRAPAAPAVSPAGGWIAEEIAGTPVALRVTSSLTLAADGSAQGKGGCNTFAGGWKQDGMSLALGPMAATMRACPPPASDQEAAFFRVLAATRGFRLDDGRLVLLDARGIPVARLRRAG